MKIELRPTGHEWTWVAHEGNVASLAGKRFGSIEDALRDARAERRDEPDPEDPPPLVA